MARLACLAVLLLGAGCIASTALADAPDSDPRRVESEIDAFVLWDSKNAVPEDAILFVGSSSIRLWETIGDDMAPYSAIRRGYGGAKFSDLEGSTNRSAST